MMKTKEQLSILQKDIWLSDIVGTPSYKLNINEVRSEFDFEKFKQELTRPIFIYARVSVSKVETIAWLERAGFRLVDTNVVFEAENLSNQKDRGEVSVRLAVQQDEKVVANIASVGFQSSRFHLDPEFDPHVANKIKYEWAKNYFQKKRGDQMLVAEVSGKVVGFCLNILGANQEVIVDLICSDPEFRRQGIARSMLAGIVKFNPNIKKIVVGTQIANQASIGLYEDLGFKLKQSFYVFHYHG